MAHDKLRENGKGPTDVFKDKALRTDAPALSGIGDLMGGSSALAVNAKIIELQKQGHPIINCTIGDLGGEGIATPRAIIAATASALAMGKTRYTPIQGIPELREAIAKQFAENEGVNYDPNTEILTSTGGRTPIFLAIWALCKQNESVIVPTPAFIAYEQLINLCRVGCHRVDTKQSGYKLTPEAFEKAILDAENAWRPAKMLIINTPGNPTGVVYSRQELKPLMEIALENGIVVMYDQMYKTFIFNGEKHFNVAAFNDAAKNWTVVIDGLSKSCAMTGLRLGYALGNKTIIAEMAKVQGMAIGHSPSVVQWGGLEAFNGATLGDEKSLFDEFKKRRDFVLSRLGKMREEFGVSHAHLDGGFYALVNFPLVGKTYRNGDGKEIGIKGAKDVASFLVSEAQVAVIPVTEFSYPDEDGAVRISYGAVDVKQLGEAFDRIETVLRKVA